MAAQSEQARAHQKFAIWKTQSLCKLVLELTSYCFCTLQGLESSYSVQLALMGEATEGQETGLPRSHLVPTMDEKQTRCIFCFASIYLDVLLSHFRP
jgi:hypothetical protein